MRYRIVPLTEQHIEKLNPGKISDIMALLAVPRRYKSFNMDVKCLFPYTENYQSAIRACVIDEDGEIAVLFTLLDIDFVNKSCRFMYYPIADIEQGDLESIITHIINWARCKAEIKDVHCDITVEPDLEIAKVVVDLPAFCIDRIIDEAERECVITYFDRYMYSPLSGNPDGQISKQRMIASSEMLLAYNKLPLGFISFYANDVESCSAYITSIAVSEEYRGTGIGRMLLERCCQIALKRGMQRIYLRVKKENKKALRFYLMWGFLKMEAEFTDEEMLYLDLR